MSPSKLSEAERLLRREALLDAAFRRFSRYGYRRTSMEDIAAEAGVSRSSLYLHFPDKEAVVRALSARLHDHALAASGSTAGRGGSFAETLREVLGVKVDMVLTLADDPAHTSELLDANDRICGDISQAFRERYLTLLADLVGRADASGEVDLRGRGLDPGDAAILIHAAAAGLLADRGDSGAHAVQRRLDQLVTVLVTGLGGTLPRSVP